MLRANRRLLRPGGRLAFFVIEVASGLDTGQRRRAAAAGPPSVSTRSDYESMLRSAGFEAVQRIDVTGEYRATVLAWNRQYRERRDDLLAVWDEALLDEKTTTGPAVVSAVDAGLLRRALYVARRPGGPRAGT